MTCSYCNLVVEWGSKQNVEGGPCVHELLEPVHHPSRGDIRPCVGAKCELLKYKNCLSQLKFF